MTISIAKTTLDVISSVSPGIRILKTTLDVISARADGIRIAKTTLDVISGDPPLSAGGRRSVMLSSL
jgi:hypothetical protein